MNSVQIVGRLTRDPDLRYLTTGNAMCRFTVAVDRRYSKEKKAEAQAKNQPTADFIPVVVWGRVAENCGKYLAKGRLVGVEGSIQTGSYQAQDGTTRYTTDVNATNVEFLEWGDRNQGFNQGYSNQGDTYPRDNRQGGYGQDTNKDSEFDADDFIDSADDELIPF